MIDYSEMTDFEINKAVAAKEKERLDSEFKKNCEERGISLEAIELFLCSPKNIYQCQSPDYCNDWAVMGHIIQDKGISIRSPRAGINDWIARYGLFSVDHKNPLRAAAIVFLMMEAE